MISGVSATARHSINPLFKLTNQKINKYIRLHSYLAIWLTLPPEVALCSLTMLLNL